MAKSDLRAAERRRDQADSAQQLRVERVEPTLLQQLIKTTKQVRAAEEAYKAAQGASQFVLTEIRETHKLRDGDAIDQGTGVITRAKAVKKKP